MTNPFNHAVDNALRGQKVQVRDRDGHTHIGWLERVHHQDGDVLLRGAERPRKNNGPNGGPVWIREVVEVFAVDPHSRVEERAVEDLSPHPLNGDVEDIDRPFLHDVVRDSFAGSFPVVRENGTIINGHRRIEACRQAGVETHPVEVVDVTDQEAALRYTLAHPPGDR